MRKIFMLALCGLLPYFLFADVNELLTVKGKIFLDANSNGLFDNGESGIPDILVSDGEEIVKSGMNGEYVLNKVPSDIQCTVFVIVPNGYKNTGSFYLPVNRDSRQKADFGLIKDEKNLNGKFSFIHTADIQWAMSSDMKKWREEAAEINRIAQENDVKFYVASGDLTQDGNLKDLSAIKDVFSEYKIPFHATFGGHDGLIKMEHPKTGNFIETFGPACYSWNYGGVHFISIVSEKNFLSEKEKKRQSEWIKNDLKAIPEKAPVIVSAHQPSYISDELWQIISEKKLLAVLMGHWHQHHCFKIEDIYILCSAPWRNLDFGAYTAKARVVTVDNGKITCKAIPLFRTKADKLDIIPGLADEIKMEKNWNSILGENGTRSLASELKLPLATAWKTTTESDQAYFSSPAIYDGKIYFGLSDGQAGFENSGVICLDAKSGTKLWKTKIGHDIYSSVAIANEKVFALDAYGRIFALSAKDGNIIWQDDANGAEARKTIEKNFSFIFSAAPLTCDKNIIYAASGKSWAAFDFAGKNLWRNSSETEESAIPGIAPGENTVFVTTRSKITAINKNDGKTVWSKSIPDLKYKDKQSRGLSTPVYHNGFVYFNHNIRLRKIDASNGNEIWASEKLGYGLNYTGIPAISDNIIVVCNGSQITAINDADGAILWKFLIRDDAAANIGRQQMLRQGSSPAIIGNKVIFGGDDGWIYVLDLKTGNKLQELRIGVPMKASAAISGNFICISDYEGNIYGLCGKTQENK